MRSLQPKAPGAALVPAPPPLSATCAGGALSGLLLAAATSQVGLGLLSFVALVPLLWTIDRGARVRAAAAAGWLCGLVFFGVALAWVPLAGYRGSLLALLAAYIALLALGVSAFSTVLAWLRARDRALFLVTAPVLWIGLEFLRSRGSLGYPWHFLGYGLAAYPALVQLAALAGTFALSLWIAGVNSAVLWARRATPGAALLAGALLLAPLLPSLRTTNTSPETLRVAAVQPGIATPGRDTHAAFQLNLRTLVDLTLRASRENPDLVVWPESAFERPLHEGGDPLLGSIAHQYGTPLLTGAWRVEGHGAGSLYNSAALAEPGGRVAIVSDKVHPVAFYERRPGSALERWMARVGSWPGRFERGVQPGLVRVARAEGDPIDVGVLVCIDTSYPELARSLRRRGARMLVEISNEAQTTTWGAVQHAHVSRLRAIETGLPLVRVANTGPSEWVDPRGRVVAALAPGSRESRSVVLPLGGEAPPYCRLGDGPAFAMGLLPLIAALLRRPLSRGDPP